MPLKITFNNEIHRFSKLPENFKDLITTITSAFDSQLPQSWTVSYLDSDGDKISVANAHDYEELLKAESSDSSLLIKLFVTPKNPTKVQDELLSSQNNGEKTVQTVINTNKVIINDQIPLNEVQPQADPQPNDEGSDKKQIKKIIRLIKSLAKGKHPEAEQNQMKEELAILESELSPEQREILQKKKEKFDAKFQARQARREAKMKEEPEAMNKIRKIKYLTRNLAKGKYPEAEQSQMKEELTKLESELTPEEKELLQKKKERFEAKFQERKAKKEAKMKSKLEQLKEKHLRIFFALKVFARLINASRKENAKRVQKLQEKLNLLLSEEHEARKMLSSAFEAIANEKDQEKLNKIFDEVKEKFLITYYPEEKEKVDEEWKKAEEKKKLREEKFRAFREEKNKETQNPEKENRKKERLLLREKFAKPVRHQAKQMSKRLPNEDFEKLCNYVQQAPEGLNIEELIAQYKC